MAAPACPKCKGKKVIVVSTKSGPKEVACPVCRGSGETGLVTK